MSIRKTEQSDLFGRPIYKDIDNEVYLDINLGKTPKPSLYTVTSAGEPLYPIDVKECSLCDSYYCGYGHNARPLSDGRCCLRCNYIVISARVANLKKKITEFKKKVMKFSI